jgi:hypothetical protein
MNPFGGGKANRPTPQQMKNDKSLSELEVDKIDSAEDKRYDAMTDVQREAYYVHPTLKTRFVKLFRGR